jgi:hypothetical protein
MEASTAFGFLVFSSATNIFNLNKKINNVTPSELKN